MTDEPTNLIQTTTTSTTNNKRKGKRRTGGWVYNADTSVVPVCPPLYLSGNNK